MKTLIPIILISFSFGSILHVPDDYDTIQEGIDASQVGDTVVVHPGLYEENILIDKSITLTSLALFDTTTNTIAESLDNWYDWITDQYMVTDENINSTIMDGSGELKSTITIATEEDLCIEPIILGFTIQDGSGTLMDRFYDDPDGGTFTIQQYMGGGILSYLANPILHYNKIQNNGGLQDVIKSGSAIYPASSSDDIDFIDRNTERNSHCGNDVFDFTHNFFENNFSSLGRHIGNRYFEGDIDLSNCVFDYWNCEGNGDYQTPIWVNIDDLDNLVAEDEQNSGCLLTGDVYVDPVNGNDDLNDGQSWENPFYTITNTLPKVIGTEQNPVNIYLAEGTYSPSTNGETFSITMISNVNLIGQGEEVTVLDAEQTGKVIIMEDCQNNIISDLTITGGLAEEEMFVRNGGGMSLFLSDPILTHVTISGNTADTHGGGMYLLASNPTLTHVTIAHNTAIDGGGMYVNYSNPTLTHVTISNNTASVSSGGGMYLYYSNPTLVKVTISNNTTDYLGGGMLLLFSDPTLTHVTIAHNTADYYGGGMHLYGSNLTLTNSIIWDNSPESIFFEDVQPIITYSDIEGGWVGDGNLDLDPLFSNPENDDYTLQEGSPCIDTGNPNLWYTDLDGTPADMGITGGLFVLPNFTSHDFGEVGDIGSSKQFTLYNFRETPISISSVNFGTTSFTTNTSFPITIEPFETGIINIDINNSIAGTVNDNMEIISDDLPEGLSVLLSLEGTEGNILTGNLSGIYDVAQYRISGDLTIADGDTAYLNAGTQFLFDSGVNFNIYGTLKAIGTESDSIIFDNYGDERWRGLTLDNVSDETELRYVRISGARKNYGGGIYLQSSNPTLTHVTISNNLSDTQGGGMYISGSNPILTHVTISNNLSDTHGGGMCLSYSNPILTHVTISNNVGYTYGGGMCLSYSNPILTHVTISNNTASGGGGMHLLFSNPTLTHVTISNNTASVSPGGGMHLWYSDPILTHVTISNNTAIDGGGMYLYRSNPTLTNSIIWDNSPESIYFYEDVQAIITYSDIEGGWEGEGNIDVDPLFTDSENNDYTLQAGSPCIDMGIVLEDMEYCGFAPDMGAYEYITEDCVECGAALGDVNGDSEINILDLVQISYYILELSTPLYECAADYNGDSEVNILDLVQIVTYILEN